jgi:hypothetical protein
MDRGVLQVTSFRFVAVVGMLRNNGCNFYVCRIITTFVECWLCDAFLLRICIA